MYTSCLFPGDQIVSVNGNPVLGKSYSQVIELIVSRSVIRSQKRFVALKSLHSPVVFSYKVLSRFYESFDHSSV